MIPQIECSLTVLLVSDYERSKTFYEDVLGFEVTPWWATRGGLNGVALKLLQASSSQDVRPNATARGAVHSFDVYAYVSSWTALEALYAEFRGKGAEIAIEPWVDEENGPWKEFAIRDLDGYVLAFGGVPVSATATDR